MAGFSYTLTAKEEARKEAVQDKILSDLAAQNLTCDRDALLALPSIRLFIVSEGAGLPDNYLDEVKRLPAVAEQVRRAEVARQLADGSSPLHADISRLNPHQRVALGHDMERAKAAERSAKINTMSAEEEASRLLALRQISSPSMRLHLAREWGLA